MARINIVIEGKRSFEAFDIDLVYDNLTGKKRLKNFVDKVVAAAEISFEDAVPKRTGKMLKATTSTPTTPTATGGWEASAGIERIHSEVEVDKQIYPLYLQRGTGLWGPSGATIYKQYTGNVKVGMGGKRPDLFYFEKNGERVFTTHFKGQPPRLIMEHVKADPKFDSVVRIAKNQLGKNLLSLINFK